MAMITKFCPGCNRDLPMSEYTKHTGNSTGYQSRCRPCQNEYGKQRRMQGKIPLRKRCDPAEVEHIWQTRGEVKACSVCRQVKARDQFRPTIKHKDGHHTECGSCRNDADKQRRWAKGSVPLEEYNSRIVPSDYSDATWRTLEVTNAGQAWAWWLDNAPEWWLAAQAQTLREKERAGWRARRHIRRARQRGVRVDPISPAILDRVRSAATHCCWCSTELTKPVAGRYVPTDATIEHIIPLIAGGAHSLENIDVACARCNYSRPKRAA